MVFNLYSSCHLSHFTLTLGVQRGFASSVSKAFDAVDTQTQSELRHAKDIQEVRKILASASVVWQDAAHCVRHNKKCRFRVDADIDTRWENLLATFFFWIALSLSVKLQTNHPNVIC